LVDKWRNTVDRQEKELFVSDLRSSLDTAGLVIVTRQSGLTVAQSTDLRTKMYQAGGNFKIAKNTLARIAVKGLPCEGVTQYLSGPTAISYSVDPVAAAQVVVKFAKTNDKVEILGGALGSKILGAEEVRFLAQLPSLDELRGQIIGLVQAPATKIARLAKEPASLLARVFSAYGQK